MKLKRTVQCKACPWRKDADQHTIPNGYCEQKHAALKNTIAEPGDYSQLGQPLRVMACHETHDAHCVGWLHNQLGPGNNIPLRIHMWDCTQQLKLCGPQHERFEDTLPKGAPDAAD